MKKTFILFFTTTLSIVFISSNAQDIQENEKETFYNIIEEDRSSINALVLYPEETRNAILEASLNPEIIIKLENIQSQTREKFIDLIDQMPEEEQLRIYDLARYENLIKSLTEGGKKSEKEIKEILKDYPEEIHSEALEIGRRNYSLIKNINELYKAASESYKNVLKDYPEETQEAYNHLIQFPEVIEILSDNMKMTVSVGDLYRREPQWVKTKLDSLNVEAAKKNAEETAEWQKRLEENPELLDEYTNAAEDYAEDKGFDESEYKEERSDVTEIRYHHYYSYPFWFGYPHWFPYSYWYRWPVWYDWGFFYGPGGAIVLTGLPSYYFTYWYFQHPTNHYYRPRLSSTFLTHFKNNPRSPTGISEGVATWIKDNREALPANLLQNDRNQVERMREYGRFESEYLEVAQRRPQLSREEFLANNPERFPNLTSIGLRVPDELARELPDLQARRTPTREPDVRREPDGQRAPDAGRVEPRERYDDIYRPREPDKDIQPDPDRRITPDQPERTLPREREIEPRPRIERRPETPETMPRPAPRPRTPERRTPPRQAPSPSPAPRPSPNQNSEPQRRTPSRQISISSELPSQMQKINHAIEFHIRNWRN